MCGLRHPHLQELDDLCMLILLSHGEWTAFHQVHCFQRCLVGHEPLDCFQVTTETCNIAIVIARFEHFSNYTVLRHFYVHVYPGFLIKFHAKFEESKTVTLQVKLAKCNEITVTSIYQNVMSLMLHQSIKM